MWCPRQTQSRPSEGSLLSGGKQAQNKGGQWFGEEMRRRYGSPEEEWGVPAGAQLGGPRCREAGVSPGATVFRAPEAVVLPLLTWHQLFSHFSHSCVHVVGVTCRILNPLHKPSFLLSPQAQLPVPTAGLPLHQHRLQGAVHLLQMGQRWSVW